MPAPKKISRTATFEMKNTALHSLNDKNHCAVLAIAVLTGEPVEKVQAACEERGRKRGQGTCTFIMRNVLRDFGWTVREADPMTFIRQYPGNHGRVLKNVTTHHPARFNKVWKEVPRALLFSRGHVSASDHGELHDWAVGRALRVHTIWIVERMN